MIMNNSNHFTTPKAKGILAAFTALAALTLGSCTQEDEPGGQPSGKTSVILFNTYVSGSTQSRASVADVESLKNTGFGVFAYETGADEYNPDATEGHTPKFMCNQITQWKNEQWQHSGKNWPSGKVSFFAYAPYATTSNGITILTNQESKGDPKLEYTMNSNVDKQVDLLYADASKTINLANAGTVNFDFKHALSRISFKFPQHTPDANTTLLLEKVSLQLAGQPVTAQLNLRNGKWENTVLGDMTYELSVANYGFSAVDNATISAPSKYIMIIPPLNGTTTKMQITVGYKVRTKDPSLPNGYTDFINTASAPFEKTFEAGKAYEITLRVSVDALNIEAEISDWDTDTGGDWNSDGTQNLN